VRSPHAHAKIVKTDVAEAIGGPGVIAVLTGGDAAANGLKPIPHSPVPTNPHEVPLRNRDGSGFFIAPHPVLARDAVRYVGEPVAIVIAETLAAAMDAAEQVGVVYEPLHPNDLGRLLDRHGFQPKMVIPENLFREMRRKKDARCQ